MIVKTKLEKQADGYYSCDIYLRNTLDDDNYELDMFIVQVKKITSKKWRLIIESLTNLGDFWKDEYCQSLEAADNQVIAFIATNFDDVEFECRCCPKKKNAKKTKHKK